MNWTPVSGNILDVPADVLVCSANVWLNLSGGVGGEILLRHGTSMQHELHARLAGAGRKFADPGEVIRTRPHGLAFRDVLHAVAINAFYETSIELVRDTLRSALETAASLGAGTVAMTALATGYGRMSLSDFGSACRLLADISFAPVAEVIIWVRHESERDELAAAFRTDDV